MSFRSKSEIALHFMKLQIKSLPAGAARTKLAIAALGLGWLCSAGSLGLAQTSSAVLSPDLQEVMTLSRQHMSDDVITSYIRSTGKTYHLSADDIVYLNNQGVSQTVITTLLQTATTTAAPVDQAPPQPPSTPYAPPAPAAPYTAPSDATPPPAPPVPYQSSVPVPSTPAPDITATATAPNVSLDYFRSQLAPYGSWVYLNGYGYCWRPDAALAVNPDWRPYFDMGQWVYTDNGWFWQSDYVWGDIPFHYGNWIIDPTYGWVWVPGYTWGPAWVFWRQADADGCIGWAPLPPGAVFVNGGWFWRGRHFGVDFDFGLGADFFVFVGYDHFHDSFLRMRGHEYRYFEPRDRVRAFYGRSVLHNDFRRDDHGFLINDGIGRDRFERVTGRPMTVTHFEERDPVGDRGKLGVQSAGQVHQSFNQPGNQGAQHFAPEANKVYRPSTPQFQGGGGQSHQGQFNGQNHGH